ncbi:MAG TPA: DMT family transporter [Gaiellaceae bacterium]|jgi:drug/metabolite transporter (DMT)-like permease
MGRRDALLIAALSMIWGASFMFIRVADRGFDPAALVWFRLLLACAVLVPVVLVTVGTRAFAQAREKWRALVVLGAVNTAVPFLLISWAETRIDSGLAAILQAAAPIFTAVIATRFGHERVTGARLAGVLVGLTGVALLVGSPGGGGLLAALAVVLAALGYACGVSFSSQMLKGTDPLVVGAGSSVAATIIATPLGIARLPGEVPGWKEIASVIVLGIAGTGLAYIIFFAAVRSAGPSRTILVTYLVPGVALLYGALLLGEPVRPVALAGLALILAGVGLAGRGRPRQRTSARPVPAAPE